MVILLTSILYESFLHLPAHAEARYGYTELLKNARFTRISVAAAIDVRVKPRKNAAAAVLCTVGHRTELCRESRKPSLHPPASLDGQFLLFLRR